MDRILLIDSEPAIADMLTKSLEGDYQITCCDPGEFLSLAQQLHPALLVVDLSAPGADMLGLLQSLFMAGFRSRIIASARYVSDYMVQCLHKLGASCLLQRPCTVNALLQVILDVMLGVENVPGNDLRRAANNLLLRLGLRMDLQGYRYLLEAVLYAAKHPNCTLTTELYPDVAKLCNATSNQVEKDIRECIQKAWVCRDEQVWRLYFPISLRKKSDRLTNGAFLKRIAFAVADFSEYSKQKTGTV